MSEQRNDGGSAFPVANMEAALPSTTDDMKALARGMSLRDYFAAKAMAAALSTVKHEDERGELFSLSMGWYEAHAFHAYAMAEAMLKARQS